MNWAKEKRLSEYYKDFNYEIEKAPFDKNLLCVVARHEDVKLPWMKDRYVLMQRKFYKSTALNDENRQFHQIEGDLVVGPKNDRFCFYVKCWKILEDIKGA